MKTCSQVPLKIVPTTGFLVLPETVAEPFVPEHRCQLIGRHRLDVREGSMTEERIGVRHGEIEGQRLAGNLDVKLVTARFRLRAILEPAPAPAGITCVVHRGSGRQKHAASDLLDDRLHGFDRPAATG